MTTPIHFHLVLPDGRAVANTTVTIDLQRAGYNDVDEGVVMPRELTFQTDSFGLADFSLWPSDQLYYLMAVDTATDAEIFFKFKVPHVAAGITLRFQDLIIEGAVSGTPTTPFDYEAFLATANAIAAAAAVSAAAAADKAAAASTSAAAALVSQVTAAASAAAALASELAAKAYSEIKDTVLTATQKLLGATGFLPNRGVRVIDINAFYDLKGDGTEDIADILQTCFNQGLTVLLEGNFLIGKTVTSANVILHGRSRWRDGSGNSFGTRLSPGPGLLAGYMLDIRGQFELKNLSFVGDYRKGVWAFGTQAQTSIGKPMWDNVRVTQFDICIFFDSLCQFPIGGTFKNTYVFGWGQAGVVIGGKGTTFTGLSGEDGLSFYNFHCSNLNVGDKYGWTPVVSQSDATHDFVNWAADIAAQGVAMPYWGYQVVRAATTAGPWIIPPDWVDSNFTQTSYTAEKVAGETWLYKVIANNPACSIARNKKVFFDTCHVEYGTIGLLLVSVRDCWIGHMYGETRNGVVSATQTTPPKGGFCVIYSNGSFVTVGSRIYCEGYAYGSFCGYNGHITLQSYDIGQGVQYGMNGNFGGAQQTLRILDQVGWDGTTAFNISPHGNVNEMRHEVHYSTQDGQRWHDSSTDTGEHEIGWFRRDIKRNTGVKFFERFTGADGHTYDMLGWMRIRPFRKTNLAFLLTNLAAGGGTNPRTDPVQGVTTTFLTVTLAGNTHNCSFVFDGHLDISDSSSNARQGVPFRCTGTMLKNSGMANTSADVTTVFGKTNNPVVGSPVADAVVTITAVGAGNTANFQINWTAAGIAPGPATARVHCNLFSHQGGGEVTAAAYG